MYMYKNIFKNLDLIYGCKKIHQDLENNKKPIIGKNSYSNCTLWFHRGEYLKTTR